MKKRTLSFLLNLLPLFVPGSDNIESVKDSLSVYYGTDKAKAQKYYRKAISGDHLSAKVAGFANLGDGHSKLQKFELSTKYYLQAKEIALLV